MISADNLSKSYAHQVLFEKASFKINDRERVGLVGRNGHGKTTLLRLIIGEETPDEGSISIPKNYRIGYVRQHLDFTEETLLKEGMKGLPNSQKDHHWKVEKVLSGLGFTAGDMKRHPSEFSGGYQVRLNLAKVLVSDPDLLLLDEPTNYLDIISIRWIERFLIEWPHELLLVTHDRTFMDKIVTHTMGMHRKKIKKIAGNTEKYYDQLVQEEEIYEKTRINDERKRKEVEHFITQFRAKARLVGMVQSRIKTLEKMEKREKLQKIKTLDFSFTSAPFIGKYVANVKDLCFSYDPEEELIRDLSLTIRPSERVCIIGPNGKGKTTLLRLLAEQLKQQHGEITWNPKTIKGVFEQTNVKTLVDSRTVEEELMYTHGNVDAQKARNICGSMMFAGDYALKKIEVLSGGEKSRVMLGKILVTPVNVLLLDEPTNHLDMESSDALLAAIDSFEGAVIMVTHNEMFLHALAQRLIIFYHDTIEVFEGSYQRFLDKGGWGDEEELLSSQRKARDAADENNRLDKKTLRKMRAEIITRRSKIITPLEKRIAKVEAAIEKNETRLKELNNAMQDASEKQDGLKIVQISQSIHTSEQAIDTLFEELEELTNSFEEHSAVFDKQLEGLEG